MAADAWPWLAVAAAGALHGLNPFAGWAFMAWHARPGAGTPRTQVLLSIAAGQIAAVALVAFSVSLALELRWRIEPWALQAGVGGLLLVLGLRHLRRRARCRPAAFPGRTGLLLWSCAVGTGHGAGWMLVPALASVCAGDAPAREITASGSLVLGLAAVGVHLAAMVATTAAMAAAARFVRTRLRRRGQSACPAPAEIPPAGSIRQGCACAAGR